MTKAKARARAKARGAAKANQPNAKSERGGAKGPTGLVKSNSSAVGKFSGVESLNTKSAMRRGAARSR